METEIHPIPGHKSAPFRKLSQFFKKDWLSILFFLLAVGAGGGIALSIIVVLGPLKSIAVIAGAFLAVFAIIRSEWGVLAFVFITYIRFSDVLIDYFGAPSIAKPLVALLAGIVLIRWALYNERPRGWLTPAVLVGAYGLVVFASLLYASNAKVAEEAFVDYFKDAVITVLIVMMVQKETTFRRVIWILLAAGIFMGSISVFQYLTQSWSNDFFGFGQAPYLNIYGETQGYRIGGPIGDPNYYAQIMLVLIPLAFICLTREKSIVFRLIAGLGFAVSLLTVVFTFSRGGFLAMIVMLIALSIYRPPKLPEFLIAGLMIFLLVRFVPETYLTRLVSLNDILGNTNEVRSDVSFRGRASEMIVGWQMFLDNPLLGVGVRNYPNLYQQYSRRLGLDPRTEDREPHNLYLEVAAETGIAGLLTFGAILGAVFASLVRARRIFKQAGRFVAADLTAALLIGMIGYLSAAIFIHGAYPRFFYLLAGIAMASLQAAYHSISSAASSKSQAQFSS